MVESEDGDGGVIRSNAREYFSKAMDRLLHVFHDVVDEHGVAEVSVDELANRAGMSRPHVFRLMRRLKNTNRLFVRRTGRENIYKIPEFEKSALQESGEADASVRKAASRGKRWVGKGGVSDDKTTRNSGIRGSAVVRGVQTDEAKPSGTRKDKDDFGTSKSRKRRGGGGRKGGDDDTSGGAGTGGDAASPPPRSPPPITPSPTSPPYTGRLGRTSKKSEEKNQNRFSVRKMQQRWHGLTPAVLADALALDRLIPRLGKYIRNLLGERGRILAHAAACRALRVAKDPVALFLWIVRRDGRFLSAADEDAAQRRLKALERILSNRAGAGYPPILERVISHPGGLQRLSKSLAMERPRMAADASADGGHPDAAKSSERVISHPGGSGEVGHDSSEERKLVRLALTVVRRLGGPERAEAAAHMLRRLTGLSWTAYAVELAYHCGEVASSLLDSTRYCRNSLPT